MKVRNIIKFGMIGILLLVTVSYFLVIGYNYKIKEKAYDYLNTQGCNEQRIEKIEVSFDYKNLWKFKNPWHIKANVYGKYELILIYKGKKIGIDKQTDQDLINRLNDKNLCNQEEDLYGKESNIHMQPNLISMVISDYVNNKVKIIIYNKTGSTYTYGGGYSLEYYKDNKWYQIIPLNEPVFDMMGYQIPSLSSADLEIDLSTYYGNLLPGKYRVIKELTLKSDSEKTVYAEARFDIV